MFLIAGVSPKIKVLETGPRICPSCGLAQAHLQRVDHYVSIFFIPIIRVRKGVPVLVCDRCRNTGCERSGTGPTSTCRQCGRRLDDPFVYCPYCGVKIR